MSATLDLDKFRLYFGGSMEVVKVEGRTYPIEMFHSLEPQPDHINAAVKTIV